MFVKNLPGQTRHCGTLPSHERKPQSRQRVRGEGEETNDKRGGGGGLDVSLPLSVSLSLASCHQDEYLGAIRLCSRAFLFCIFLLTGGVVG